MKRARLYRPHKSKRVCGRIVIFLDAAITGIGSPLHSSFFPRFAHHDQGEKQAQKNNHFHHEYSALKRISAAPKVLVGSVVELHATIPVVIGYPLLARQEKFRAALTLNAMTGVAPFAGSVVVL